MYIDGFGPVTKVPDSTLLRSRLLADIISERADQKLGKVIRHYSDYLNFTPIEDFMISQNAWTHTSKLGVEPKLVFAHPDILQAAPKTSAYYRGIALLSRKRVAQGAGIVTDWEEGDRKAKVPKDKAISVARFYNVVISSIIEGSTDWTLDNGYRNILAATGISLDGMFRNKIGSDAEALIKNRILSWLKVKSLVFQLQSGDGTYSLPMNTQMRYGSEPDIAFKRDDRLIATIEIKGGTDPAGALERLGAMTKSFAETPPGCINFLVAGVITPEMRSRLNEMGVVKVYELGELSEDGEMWEEFTTEVFHHAVRVM